jgi:GT2 family glycosyltransferase
MAGDIRLREGDSMTIVDNRPGEGPAAQPPGGTRPRLVVDGRVPSSYYARNRGVEGGSANWIVFIDADVVGPADLIDRYFDAAVADDVAVLAGGVQDEPVAAGDWRHPAARYVHLRAAMGQENTIRGPWAYAQTANCAVRRSAFEFVGGFDEGIRSGGDADLCFRLRAAGWTLQSRDGALVIHRNRPLVRALLRQRARHGSGAAWLNRRYPGSFPRRLSVGTLVWSAKQGARLLIALLQRDSDRAILLGGDVATRWAFELGRLLSNHAVRSYARAPVG